MTQSLYYLPKLPAPQAKKIPFAIEKHGDRREDPYFWLRQKENPDVLALLHAENTYMEAALAPVKNLRDQIFHEIKNRLKEDDSSVPYVRGGFEYYTRLVPGEQYAVYARKPIVNGIAGAEEVLLDCNALAAQHKAAGKDYFKLGAFDVSPDQNWLAYAVDDDGSEKYTILFKNLKNGAISAERITGTYASIEWAADNRTIFYNLLDEHERPDRLMRYRVGDPIDKAMLLYKEADPQLFLHCEKSRDKRFIFMVLEGKVTSEVWYLDAARPMSEFKVISPRRRGVLYSVDSHGANFLIVTNDTVQNFRLVTTPVATLEASPWRELRAGSDKVFLEGCDVFQNHLVLHERENGLPQMRVIAIDANSVLGAEHLVEFPEPAYSLGGESNPNFDTTFYRFSYTSLVTPNTVYDYDLSIRKKTVRKTQEIPGGYDASAYRSERVFANAKDGTQVPISLVYKLDDEKGFATNGDHRLYLYAYGSYGFSMSPTFSVSRLSLLDRGFVFAIAHVRGGSEMGRQWYEDGKFLKKRNTFTDFISCAEHLITNGFTKAGQIAISGGSAGGMLVGAVINERPDLFWAATARVPFVDVVNTMLDQTLPLTTIEYEEWGNPEEPEYYHCMKTYSPYDNVKAQDYPHLLVTSGLNDPRVTYWEPAKWVARLRELKTDHKLLIQSISMGAGHGGPSGRYEALKETAMEYAFLFLVFGLTGG